jgi:hypothetical protein
MYFRKNLIEQVINLFITIPEYRDNRIGTVEYIINKYYKNYLGKSIKTDFKLFTDIDRAFRYIQQNEPSLRGIYWGKRQKKSGRYSSEKRFEKIVQNQLKLF